MRKITSPLDRPSNSFMWLQRIITWSIFITLSPLFFQIDLEDVIFMPYFMWKVRKWMEDSLSIQNIIGHFMILFPTSTIYNSLNFWIFLMVQISKCHSRGLFHAIFFGQEQILNGRPCLDVRHYRSFLKKNIEFF